MEYHTEKPAAPNLPAFGAFFYGPNRWVPPTKTKIQKWATSLLELHRVAPEKPSEVFAPIRLVCISDTCSNQPQVPEGDLLIHTGQLSLFATPDTIQEQLTWLSSLPHKHKIIIGYGLESLFLSESWRTPGSLDEAHQTATGDKLYCFGNTIYLHDSGVTLNFGNNRQVSVFGAVSSCAGMQDRRQRRQALKAWKHSVPRHVDVLVTNESLYRFDQGFRQGHRDLMERVICTQPGLVVSSGWNAGTDEGLEDIVFDGVRGEYEDIMAGFAGYAALYRMWVGILAKQTGFGMRKLLRLKPQVDYHTKLISCMTGIVEQTVVTII